MTALQEYCNQNDLIFQGEPREDYGIDAYIEVVSGTSPLNFIVAIQVKTGPSYRRSETANGFTINLRPSDVLYWLGANLPVIFVYLHDGTGELFWRHVQAEPPIGETATDSLKIEFKTEDGTSSRSLASYLRDLAAHTPTALDRVSLLGVRAGRFEAGQDQAEVFIEPHLDCLQQARITLEPSNIDYGWSFPADCAVIGYSPSGQHVAYFDVEHFGQKCSAVSVVVLDMHSWVAVREVLYTEEDYDSYPKLPEEIATRRVDRANEALAHYLISLPIFHWTRMRLSYLDWEQAQVILSLGRDKLELEVVASNSVSRLFLVNRRFWPAREASMVVTQADMGRAVRRSGSVTSYVEVRKAKRFEHIVAAWISPSRSMISLGLRTNSEHSCQGNEDVRLVHLLVRDLRDLAVQGLER